MGLQQVLGWIVLGFAEDVCAFRTRHGMGWGFGRDGGIRTVT